MAKKRRTPRATGHMPETTAQTPPSPAEFTEEEDKEVIEKCIEALNAIRGGKHKKSVRLMKALCQRYDNSPLVHRINGTVTFKAASIIDCESVKRRYLSDSVKSAKRAVTLSPNSIEFAQFYATVLLESANDSKDYDEVVLECERALAIEKPNDPVEENPLLRSENRSESENADARIAQVQQELKALIQRSNLATISSWVKNLGVPTGQDNFRLIPVRRMPEDPLESRYLQNNGGMVRKSNEIKKAVKTEEERRKEIEVRVAAAKLVQQKSEFCPGGDGDESKGNVSGFVGSSGSRINERRRHKNLKRNANNSEMKAQVRSFWNSLSCEMKKDLLSVKFSDIKKHASDLCKDGGQACEILSETLTFVERSKTWKFWACCRCGEKLLDSESHVQHVIHEHDGILSLKLPIGVPQNVGDKLSDMLVNYSWKPIDLTAAVGMLEFQLKLKDSDSFGGNSLGSIESWDCILEQNNFVGSCDVDGDVESETCDVNEVLRLVSDFPLSDDSDRTKLLDKISFLLKVLVSHKYLAVSHLVRVMQIAMDELQGIVHGSQISRYGVVKIPLCICFLGATQLKKVMKFLQEVSHSCGLGRYPDKENPEEASIYHPLSDQDNISVIIDDSVLPCDGTKEDVYSGVCFVISGKDVQSISDSDSLLSWIYAGPSCVEELATWARSREDKAKQGVEVIKMVEKEFELLQHLCDKKQELFAYNKVLRGLEGLCLEEIEKRECGAESPHCSYDYILKKRRDELLDGENEVSYISKRLELDMISNILKEAENLDVNQFGFEHTYGVNAHLQDIESGEDDQKSKNYPHLVNICVDAAFQRQKEHLSIEFSKLDARMLRSVTTMRLLKLKLDTVSSFDCQSILVPLVKSFMRAHLEDLAEKDATEKSDAAREAFLAELDLDSKRGSGFVHENSKNSQEKMKDKRRNKDSRKNKDSKAGICDEQFDSTEPSTVATAYDGAHVDPDVTKFVSGSNANELEEEFQRMVELKSEERKLEETLQYQRQMENDAKQKLLTERRGRNALHSTAPPLVWAEVSADNGDSIQGNLNLDVGLGSFADTFQAPQKLDSPIDFARRRILDGMDDMEGGDVMIEYDDKIDVVGAGLQNEVGEYNCFLNVIIQSLWHLKLFREEFLKRSTMEHNHVGNPCVVCSLFDILSALSVAAGDPKKEPVAPTSLRTALSNVYPESKFFQQGQMNDASEVLGVIFECLHKSSTGCSGSWDDTNPLCIAHSLFGMDNSERMDCSHCGLVSRHLNYTSFFYNVNASALRDKMKESGGRHSFDELMNLVEMNHQLTCDPEAGGCGKFNHISHILSNPPHVFTAVLGWKSTHESVEDITTTLAGLATEIDLSVLYRGLGLRNMHRLVSVVCYYGQHYHCFAYSCDRKKWIMCDDQIVKVVGTWEDVLRLCEIGHIQPQVLFYEAVNK